MEEFQDLGQKLVEEIRQGMIYDDAWRPVEGGFEYWLGSFRQSVTSDGPHLSEGVQVWRVTVRTDFIRAKDPGRDSNQAALGLLGRKLCLCALTQGEEPDEWQLVSSVFIHEGIASWIMRPLFQACSHHLLHCLEWPKLMPELEPDFAPWHSSSSGKQDASLAGTIQEQVKSFISSGKDTEHPFLQNEIDQLAANFQNPPSILCNAGRGALTAEFPFS